MAVIRQRQLEIEVTQELIDEAQGRDSGHCMIAEAIKKAIPKAAHVAVDLQSIRFSDRIAGKRYLYFTPAACQDALIDFDYGTAVQPFKFRMRQAQVTPITSSKNRRNAFGRPNTPGRVAVGATAVKPIATGGSRLPVKVGGALPPVAVLAHGRGRIRQFGLKRLRP
jgi:hypothetical protein